MVWDVVVLIDFTWLQCWRSVALSRAESLSLIPSWSAFTTLHNPPYFCSDFQMKRVNLFLLYCKWPVGECKTRLLNQIITVFLFKITNADDQTFSCFWPFHLEMGHTVQTPECNSCPGEWDDASGGADRMEPILFPVPCPVPGLEILSLRADEENKIKIHEHFVLPSHTLNDWDSMWMMSHSVWLTRLHAYMTLQPTLCICTCLLLCLRVHGGTNAVI